MKRILFIAFALCCAAGSLGAQQSASLDRAETLAANGKYGEARATLAQWWSTHRTPRSSESPLVARALLLRARLTMHPDTAEKDYLRIVLEHPSSPQTPEALLRLGQHFLAQGDVERGRVYLRRLTRDFPGSPQRATALAFLARADSTKPAPRAKAVAVEDERKRPATPRAQPTPKRESDVARSSATGNYSLQSGAFRLQSGAVSLAARLRKAGYDARVVSTGGELKFVRVGRYASAKDAVDVAKRIRAQGFTAVVVDDVVREKPVR